MAKLYFVLIVSLVFLSCKDSNEYEFVDTVTRDEFAVIAKNSTGAIDANWESPEVLVLTFKQGSLEDRVKTGIDKDGNQTYEPRAVGLAVGNAILGSEAIKLKTCVKVRYPDGQELAYECANYP